MKKKAGKVIDAYMVTGISTTPAAWMAGHQAVQEAIKKAPGDPTFAIVFTSPQYDESPLLEGVSHVLKDAEVVGVKVGGPLFNEEAILDEGVIVTLFGGKSLKYQIKIVGNIDKNLHRALEKIKNEFDIVDDLLILITHTPINLEILLDELENGMKNSKILALCLGDPYNGIEGKIFSKSISGDNVLLAFSLSTGGKTLFGKKNGYLPLFPRKVTRAEGQIVYSLNDIPAAKVFHDIIKRRGHPVSDWDSIPPKYFHLYMAGIPSLGNGILIRPLGVTPEGGVLLTRPVDEGETLWIMEAKEEYLLSTSFEYLGGVLSTWEEKPLGAFIIEGFPRPQILGSKIALEKENITKLLGSPFVGITAPFEAYKEDGKRMRTTEGAFSFVLWSRP